MQTTHQPVIEIRGLCTRFGKTVIHDALDLTVMPGEIVSLVGGSGSGKTTLIRQMLGLATPAQGTVRIFGQNIHASSTPLQEVRRRWGMLFQHGALFSAMTVFDNVAQPLRELRGLPEELIQDAVMLKLQMVGMTAQDAVKMPANLSGGMIKRVALARALVLEPELLFLDEPTAGLDPELSESFVELIQSLHDAMRLTVVMVTHDLDTLFSLSTQVAVLAEKRVVIYAPPAEVVHYRHPFIEQFFLGERGRRAMQAIGAARLSEASKGVKEYDGK
jgi:phospholipid/cholesterol/gamma-HCH transport system ATP-binding protein